jgi:two-component system, LytTR family, sensor kinase
LVNTSSNNILPALQPVVQTRLQVYGLFKRRWLYHILFWILYYFFVCVVLYNAYQIHDFTFYVQFILFMPFSAALVYVNLYILIPFFLYRKKYIYYALLLLLALIGTAFIDQLLKLMYAHFGSKIFAFTADLNFQNLFLETTAMFYLTGFTTSFKLSKDWIQNQQLMKEREKQYLETELNFLKAQIQPHFFFNTLNNLYSLTLKKSDLAPEIVLKLSGLMSYMLYESNTPKVSLSKEITYLQNYLDLEKLRFGQRLIVTFEIEGHIEEVNIPPMILILFLENSFKHGVKNNLNKIGIDISLKVEGGFLSFTVKNPVTENMSTGDTGIGLKNAKRRLELLYGNNYSLDLSERQNEFIVSLKMPV